MLVGKTIMFFEVYCMLNMLQSYLWKLIVQQNTTIQIYIILNGGINEELILGRDKGNSENNG